MRTPALAAVLALIVLALPQALSSQRITDSPLRSAPALDRATADLLRPASARVVRATRSGRGSGQVGILGRRTVYTIAGAAIGSWLGYMASQLQYSDWDRDTYPDLPDHRRTYTAGGAAGGAAIGFWAGWRGGGEILGRPAVRGREIDARRIILREEVRSSGRATAYDVIASTRPEWLRGRGPTKLPGIGTGKTPPPSNDPRANAEEAPSPFQGGEVELLVYLDRAQLAGMDALQQIPATNVEYIEFLDPHAAASVFGQRHARGVILVSTVPF